MLLRVTLQVEPSGQILATDCLLVPPLVTTMGTFFLPWLPERTWQCQELQKQAADHSQCLKVKSKQEQLGMLLRSGWSSLQGSKVHLGAVRGGESLALRRLSHRH